MLPIHQQFINQAMERIRQDSRLTGLLIGLHSGGTLSGNEASACVMASGDNLTSLVSPSIIRLFYFAGGYFRSVVTVLDRAGKLPI